MPQRDTHSQNVTLTCGADAADAAATPAARRESFMAGMRWSAADPCLTVSDPCVYELRVWGTVGG